MHRVVEVGGFRCAMLCLVHVDALPGDTARGAYETLCLMLPFFYQSKVYLAALNRGDIAEFFNQTDPPVPDAGGAYIWQAFRASFERNREIHERGLHTDIRLCCNGKVNYYCFS